MARPRTWRIAILILFAGVAPARAGDALDSLAWMAGTWSGEEGGVEMEEHWTAPNGGSMLGLHRDVARARTVSFEFLRISAGTDGVTYWASPKGRPATPFKLVENKERRVVFENPDHDFPQRILYWLGPEGMLQARIEGLKGEKPQEWRWRRVAAQ